MCACPLWVKSTRETLEDAAVGLTDAGMHKAARIVLEFAKDAPSEDDREEACPYEGEANIRAWHQSAPHRRDARRQWREERRRRKREGTWFKPLRLHRRTVIKIQKHARATNT